MNRNSTSISQLNFEFQSRTSHIPIPRHQCIAHTKPLTAKTFYQITAWKETILKDCKTVEDCCFLPMFVLVQESWIDRTNVRTCTDQQKNHCEQTLEVEDRRLSENHKK